MRTRIFAALAAAAGLTAGFGLVGRATAQSGDGHAHPPAAALAPGDSVPTFTAQALDGTRKTVDYPKDQRTVLLFFLSGCGKCQKMIPVWNGAFERKPKGIEVYGVMLDQEPPGFFSTFQVRFPVLRAPSAGSFREQFKIHQVPITLRVAPGGKVEDVAVGPLDLIRLGQLFRP